MNRCKYAAALTLSLYDLNSAEIAQIVNVPVRLVSKWRTEPLFTSTVEQLQIEFYEELEKTVSGKIIAAEICSDAGLYNPTLKKRLFETFERAVAEADSAFVFRCWPIIRSLYRVQTEITFKNRSNPPSLL
jgi:hypothetical protein